MPKRTGRPAKAATGERTQIGIRVTSDMKQALLDAAERSGRSISQECELRLEQSLEGEGRLILARGQLWAPVLMEERELQVLVGDDSPADVLALRVSAVDMRRLRRFFGKEDPGEG